MQISVKFLEFEVLSAVLEADLLPGSVIFLSFFSVFFFYKNGVFFRVKLAAKLLNFGEIVARVWDFLILKKRSFG